MAEGVSAAATLMQRSADEVTGPAESPAAALDADYTPVTNRREFRDTRNRAGWDAGPDFRDNHARFIASYTRVPFVLRRGLAAGHCRRASCRRCRRRAGAGRRA